MTSIRIRLFLYEKTTKKLWRKVMRDNKEKHKEVQNKVQNEQLSEISNTDYGLESVAKGTDFAEGDKNNSPNNRVMSVFSRRY
jgi:hypothetical protein